MCSLFCILGFLLCLGHVPWPRAFTITVLNIVFCFSAHGDITHLSSLWFILLFGYFSCVALKFILCFNHVWGVVQC